MLSPDGMNVVMNATHHHLLHGSAKSEGTDWSVIGFAIFMAISVSVVFYLLVFWAISDSSGRQRKSRAKTGDDFTVTKKKKKVSVAVNSTKNANKTVPQASASNAKNSDKKKVVDSGRGAATTDSVADPVNGDSRSGRSSSRSALDLVENRSKEVDDPAENDGEWITKTSNGNVSSAILNSVANVCGKESNRQKGKQQIPSEISAATKSDRRHGPQSEKELKTNALPDNKPSLLLLQASQQPTLEQSTSEQPTPEKVPQKQRCDKKPTAQQQQQKKTTVPSSKKVANKQAVSTSTQPAANNGGVEQQVKLAVASAEKRVRVEAEAERAAAIAVSEKKLKASQAEYERKLKASQAEHERKLKASQAEHERKLKASQAEHERQLKASQAELERQLKTSLAEHERHLKAASLAEHDRQLKALLVEHQKTVNQLQESATSQYTILEQELRSKDRDISVMKRVHIESETTYNALIADQKCQLSGLQAKHKALQEEFDKFRQASNTHVTNDAAQDKTSVQGRCEDCARLKDQCANLQLEGEAAINDLITKHEGIISGLQIEYNSMLKRVQAEHAIALDIANKGQENTVQNLQADHEAYVESLRIKHKAALVTLRREEQDSAAVNMSTVLEQHRTVVERLEGQLAQERQQQPTEHRQPPNSNSEVADENVILTLESENQRLQGTIAKYQQIIADTEKMLGRLHGHVEEEELRWSQHAEDLQKQLDEAHRELDDVRRERNEQVVQKNSYDEDQNIVIESDISVNKFSSNGDND